MLLLDQIILFHSMIQQNNFTSQMEKQKTLTPQKIYEAFQKYYPILKNVKLRPITTKMNNIYHGASKLKPIKQDQYTYVGKTRQRQILPQFIMLNFTQQNAVFVLLHEITHCLVPQVELKRDDKWVLEDHSRVFYQRFWQIIKQSNSKGLYHKKFDSLQHLMRYDKSV